MGQTGRRLSRKVSFETAALGPLSEATPKKVPPVEMRGTGQRVVVLLGMHRSGTSPITRGLKALGVELGDDLLPAAPENPTGFWEDAALYGLNERLLASIGRVWHSVAPIRSEIWNLPEMQAFKLEAVETVRTRFGNLPLWGFKDPRTARLLPFWQDLFKHLGIAESYVLIIRNPISVARSLKVRNQFALEKSYLLWLEHSVEAYTHTCGMPRVVVDYDALMAHPAEQLRRIAERLALPLDPTVEDAIKDYTYGFLDNGLRHSAFEPTDVYLDIHAPDLVSNTYDMLRQVALDQLDADSKEVQSALSSARSGLGGFAPFFLYSDLLEAERDSIRRELEEVREKSIQLTGEVAHLREAIVGIEAEHKSELSERDRQNAELAEALQLAQSARDDAHSGLVAVESKLSERDRQNAELAEALQLAQSARDDAHSALGTAESKLSERDRQNAELAQELRQTQSARDEAHAALTEAGVKLTDKKRQNAELAQELRQSQSACDEAHFFLTAANSILNDKESQIAELANELQQARVACDKANIALNEIDSKVREKELKIAELAQELRQTQAARDEAHIALTQAESKSNEKDSQIGELVDQGHRIGDKLRQTREEMLRTLSNLEVLRITNASLTPRVQSFAQANSLLQSELHNLWNSRSWRLFRPLRNFVRKRQGLDKETEPVSLSEPQTIQTIVTIRQSLCWELTTPLRLAYRLVPWRNRNGSDRAEAPVKPHEMDVPRLEASPQIEFDQTNSDCQERDFHLIREDATFDADFFLAPHLKHLSRDDAIRLFLQQWTNGVAVPRKPCPGFNPNVYSAQVLADQEPHGTNPFVHFVERGKPAGQWLAGLIEPNSELMRTTKLRIALHIHAYYPELIDELLPCLMHNRSRCDLFVTTVSDSDAADIRGLLESRCDWRVSISIVPNRGRDIGPFFSQYHWLAGKYDLVGHIHTKKTPQHPPIVGQAWRRFLWQNLLGPDHHMLDIIARHFQDDSKLGLVFPDDPNLEGWGSDRTIAAALARKMGLDPDLPDAFDFPEGTMFWCRPKALRPLFLLNLSWSDYPDEPVPVDGTILHAIERLLPLIVQHEGYRIALTHIPGMTR